MALFHQIIYSKWLNPQGTVIHAEHGFTGISEDTPPELLKYCQSSHFPLEHGDWPSNPWRSKIPSSEPNDPPLGAMRGKKSGPRASGIMAVRAATVTVEGQPEVWIIFARKSGFPEEAAAVGRYFNHFHFWAIPLEDWDIRYLPVLAALPSEPLVSRDGRLPSRPETLQNIDLELPAMPPVAPEWFERAEYFLQCIMAGKPVAVTIPGTTDLASLLRGLQPLLCALPQDIARMLPIAVGIHELPLKHPWALAFTLRSEESPEIAEDNYGPWLRKRIQGGISGLEDLQSRLAVTFPPRSPSALAAFAAKSTPDKLWSDLVSDTTQRLKEEVWLQELDEFMHRGSGLPQVPKLDTWMRAAEFIRLLWGEDIHTSASDGQKMLLNDLRLGSLSWQTDRKRLVEAAREEDSAAIRLYLALAHRYGPDEGNFPHVTPRDFLEFKNRSFTHFGTELEKAVRETITREMRYESGVENCIPLFEQNEGSSARWLVQACISCSDTFLSLLLEKHGNTAQLEDEKITPLLHKLGKCPGFRFRCAFHSDPYWGRMDEKELAHLTKILVDADLRLKDNHLMIWRVVHASIRLGMVSDSWRLIEFLAVKRIYVPHLDVNLIWDKIQPMRDQLVQHGCPNSIYRDLLLCAATGLLKLTRAEENRIVEWLAGKALNAQLSNFVKKVATEGRPVMLQALIELAGKSEAWAVIGPCIAQWALEDWEAFFANPSSYPNDGMWLVSLSLGGVPRQEGCIKQVTEAQSKIFMQLAFTLPEIPESEGLMQQMSGPWELLAYCWRRRKQTSSHPSPDTYQLPSISPAQLGVVCHAVVSGKNLPGDLNWPFLMIHLKKATVQDVDVWNLPRILAGQIDPKLLGKTPSPVSSATLCASSPDVWRALSRKGIVLDRDFLDSLTLHPKNVTEIPSVELPRNGQSATRMNVIIVSNRSRTIQHDNCIDGQWDWVFVENDMDDLITTAIAAEAILFATKLANFLNAWDGEVENSHCICARSKARSRTLLRQLIEMLHRKSTRASDERIRGKVHLNPT